MPPKLMSGFIQLEQIINFSSHFPQSLQPLVTDQFCILLKQVNNNQALELIRQATFLSPSLKNSLCREYQPNLASSSLTSAPVLQNLSLINFILRIFDKIKLIANHNWKNLSLILLFVIWWKIRKHFNKWILWLMQLALSIV
ncbi:hypothetical protein HMI55_003599 [Coelomomyces lativittatus]|nr:hypothetical protein HMI55_003599 [Coelomomyces lativittatus]